MILQALCEYYDRKAALREMPPYGREWKPIPYLVVINKDGDFLRLESTLEGEGNKQKAHKFLMPNEVKGRTIAINPNNLYDKASYVFGSVDEDNSNARDLSAKMAFAQRVKLLASLNKDDKDKGIDSVCSFYNKFESNFELIKKDPIFKDAIKKNNNLFAFKVQGKQSIVGEDEITLPEEGKETGLCLVTGNKNVPLIRISKKIKIKSQKALSSGAVLVGFNSKAFESYGKSQGDNAPISDLADFKFTSALDYLLGSKRNCMSFAGDKLIYWASKDNKFEDAFQFFFTAPPKDDPDLNVAIVQAMLKSPLYGTAPEEIDTKFYIALLCPAQSRIAVKLWVEGSIKEIASNIRKYFNDLEIDRDPGDKEYMPLGNLLRSISLQYKKKENLPPQLFQSMMRAILEGLPFPELLQTQTIGRVRADRIVNRNRAALLKAYLNRKRNNNEKEITMSLDLTNNNQAYLCGRLFAIFEKIQQEANPSGVNSTIRDQYFDSFSCTPNVAFARLSALSNHHLQKLARGRQVYFERLKGEVMDNIDPNGLPAHFSLDDQSRFTIGYYHQHQAFFKKKDEESSDSSQENE